MHAPSQVWAEIDLDILAKNYRVIRQRLAPTTKILAVVKADAYGHGLIPVCRQLAAAGVDYLGVANLDEGQALQAAGIRVPVLILREAMPWQVPGLLISGLIPTVCRIAGARMIASAWQPGQPAFGIHLRIDSGYDDDGLPAEEWAETFQALVRMDGIAVTGLFTHLSAAYGEDLAAFSDQLAKFQTACDLARQAGLSDFMVHAASSPAAFQFPASHFDLVRIGTALYGVPFVHDETAGELLPVMQIKARVTSVKHFPAACRPGYGIGHENNGGTTLAYVSAGYADLPFLAHQERLPVLIRGQRCYLFGKAHMDYIQVDITHHPTAVEPGDEVVLLGRQQDETLDAAELTTACGLSRIQCEIACFLGCRVNRIYLGSADSAHGPATAIPDDGGET